MSEIRVSSKIDRTVFQRYFLKKVRVDPKKTSSASKKKKTKKKGKKRKEKKNSNVTVIVVYCYLICVK